MSAQIAKAVKLGEQVHPQLALIDVVLQDEIQCALQLRSVSPSTRMVVVSAHPGRGFRKQGLSPSSTKGSGYGILRQVIEDALR